MTIPSNTADSTTPTKSMTVHMDARGRVNLAPLKPKADTFLVDVADNGTILLTPAVMIPLMEAAELMELQSRRRDDAAAAQQPQAPAAADADQTENAASNRGAAPLPGGARDA